MLICLTCVLFNFEFICLLLFIVLFIQTFVYWSILCIGVFVLSRLCMYLFCLLLFGLILFHVSYLITFVVVYVLVLLFTIY